MRNTLIIVLALLLGGCPKPFQPVAPTYQLWSKRGASELDIKKALLECGEPAPDVTVQMYEYAFGIKDDDTWFNTSFLASACMENAGYKPRRYTVKEYCSWDRYQHLLVCQPNAVIPTPSVERRLNSWYCKLETDYEYCRKHAVVPSGCDLERIKHPPLECLP